MLPQLVFFLSKVHLVELLYLMNVLGQHLVDELIVNFSKLSLDLRVILQGFIHHIQRENGSSLEELLDYSNFEFSLHVLGLLLHRGVPVVFDGVVGSAIENLGDFSPFVAYFSVLKKQGPFFFI